MQAFEMHEHLFWLKYDGILLYLVHLTIFTHIYKLIKHTVLLVYKKVWGKYVLKLGNRKTDKLCINIFVLPPNRLMKANCC